MKYTFDKVNMVRQGDEFDKNSSREVLQYAIGGLL